jgi:hypothetical protein
MEKNSDPKTLLSTLDNSLAKIKTLLAWLQLKRLEVRVDQPPAFVMYDPTPVDLRNELLFFMLVSQQLRDIVNDKTSRLNAGKRNQHHDQHRCQIRAMPEQAAVLVAGAAILKIGTAGAAYQ